MGKRVRITNSSVNSYGTRVLTNGLDISQYERNPVLLYMHERGTVIGYMKDLRLEGDELTGEPVFDEASELSQRCKKQWDFGSLRMVSIGIDIIETSESPEHILQGQSRPTITKSKLDEVSVVDIGANDDAIVLKKDGRRLINENINEVLHLMKPNNNQQKSKEMKLNEIALLLGLPETADETKVKETISSMMELRSALEASTKEVETLSAQIATLKEEKEAMELAGITGAVDKAIAERRIEASKKEQFVELGKKVGVEELENVFAAMTVKEKASAVLRGGRAVTEGNSEWKTLRDVPADKIAELRANDREEYARLYKATYGMEPTN
ncbi:MAG: HK97 family phage prohead protease [Muribaculaceae bacterium]|nr:HK97 family phage prohead protease [Muribaculaceae bacterium]